MKWMQHMYLFVTFSEWVGECVRLSECDMQYEPQYLSVYAHESKLFIGTVSNCCDHMIISSTCATK